MCYKYLPEQVENLKKSLDINLLKLKKITEIRKAEEIKSSDQSSKINCDMDVSLGSSFLSVTNEIGRIKEQLSNCQIIIPSNSDVIGIGSTFELSWYDGDVMEDAGEVTLVESQVSGDPTNYISIVSPVGKAVLGKKCGDIVKYVVNDNILTCKITDIIKPNELDIGKQKTLNKI